MPERDSSLHWNDPSYSRQGNKIIPKLNLFKLIDHLPLLLFVGLGQDFLTSKLFLRVLPYNMLNQ